MTHLSPHRSPSSASLTDWAPRHPRRRTFFTILGAFIVITVFWLLYSVQDGRGLMHLCQECQMLSEEQTLASATPDYLLELEQLNERPVPRKKGEKYLAYLCKCTRDLNSAAAFALLMLTLFPNPLACSGFHNQRVELANAMMLAHLLNRTLLVPPITLGKVVGWRPYDKLLRTILRRDRLKLRTCTPSSPKRHTDECGLANRYTYLHWDYLMSFRDLRGMLKMKKRHDHTPEWLERELGVRGEDVFYIKDNSMYEYRILESNQTLEKYSYGVSVDALRKVPHRLLHFGSMFGGQRLALSKENEALYQRILESFMVTHPAIEATVGDIVARLGGAWGFSSAHVRVGDGAFRENAKDSVNLILSELKEHFPPPTLRPHSAADCRRDVPFLFLATDARHPKTSEVLRGFYEQYPCIATLSDMFDLTQSPLWGLRNELDNIPLGKLLIPFVDALVAARGEYFVQTHNSTFSRYVMLIRQRLRRAAGLLV
ncbi:uncharacterized protein VTP21DRAFT_7113 [Calcarisporiella thermophila]|uniref:uncharacterized protein n=1 Tax=Calcarisporiella thermophila TaxID=911321 RepID=UPI0037430476